MRLIKTCIVTSDGEFTAEAESHKLSSELAVGLTAKQTGRRTSLKGVFVCGFAFVLSSQISLKLRVSGTEA